ncbi:hypothetical protein A2U01_0090257, partial [Trifolium medium]|nr:hypothetical protein [Trifolium medium]
KSVPVPIGTWMTWAAADPSLDRCMYPEGVYSTGKPDGGHVTFGDE